MSDVRFLDAATEGATWLGRFRDARPIRQRGAFHLLSCREGDSGEGRVVIVGAADADASVVAGHLDEAARLLALIDHPTIPRPAARARQSLGEIEYLALACDAVADMETVIERCYQSARLPLPGGGLGALYSLLGLALSAAHETVDPRDGLPITVGSFSWGNVLVDRDGRVAMLGIGVDLCGRSVDGRLLAGVRPVCAPELLFEGRATPAADVYGLAMLMREMIPLFGVPEAVTRIGAGQLQPGDQQLARLMGDVARSALSPEREDRFQSIDELLAGIRRVAQALGQPDDPAGLQRVLREMVADPDPDEGAVRRSRARPELRDLQSGRYRMDRFLGAGASGAVYLARDRQLRQPVALKVIRIEQHPQLRSRFSREVRILRTIQHPHLVRGYDLFEERGRLVAVMEFIAGEELGPWAEAHLEIRPLCGRIREIALALSALHAKQLVHRDIKPSNVIVNPRRGAVLVDLGVVGDGNATRDLTAQGALLGTVRYMSPEQLRGLPASSGSDVFALGVVLLELLYGGPTFGPESRAHTGRLREWLEGRPQARVAVPAALTALLHDCLHPEPEARPGATAMARRLSVIELDAGRSGV